MTVRTEFGTLFLQCKAIQGCFSQKHRKHKQIVETTETNSLYDLRRLTMLLGNAPHVRLGNAPQIIYHHNRIRTNLAPTSLQFLFNYTTSREGGERDHCHLY